MADRDSQWRQERIARNEVSFRRINERLESDRRLLRDTEEPQPFICECGLRTCQETVHLTLAEYEELRSHGRQFAVLPGHELPEAENVIARNERYYVVEKIGVGLELSEEQDPRRPDTADATDATDATDAAG